MKGLSGDLFAHIIFLQVFGCLLIFLLVRWIRGLLYLYEQVKLAKIIRHSSITAWLNFSRLQAELRVWTNYNFPQKEPRLHRPVLGAAEEVGELCHSLLKEEQNIRGDVSQHIAKGKDAVADAIVYLADYCNQRGWDMQEIMETTWKKVQQRDWIKYPDTGKPPAPKTDQMVLVEKVQSYKRPIMKVDRAEGADFSHYSVLDGHRIMASAAVPRDATPKQMDELWASLVSQIDGEESPGA